MSEKVINKSPPIDGNKNVEGTGLPYQIPREPGKKSAILLAAFMHVLLVLFLWIGIHWQSKEPVGVEAEIWDMKTRDAAPAPLPVVINPPPVKVQSKQPKPDLKQAEPDREAEIAIERAYEKKIREQKRLEEQQKEIRLKEQQEQQKRKDELQQQQKKQELAKMAEQKRAEAVIQQQRNDNLKRLASQVAGSGDAVKSSGNNRVDPDYAGKIAAKIKSNMVYVGSDNGSENPTVDFRIELLPDGSLRGAPRKTKSSGVPAFDNAVERAITKASPYPADKSGNVPTTIPLTYRLRD